MDIMIARDSNSKHETCLANLIPGILLHILSLLFI